MTDTLIYFGDAAKSLDESGDRFGGYLVRFGTPDTHDLSSYKDYFTEETRFGLEHLKSIPMHFHHTLDPVIGDRELGAWEFKADKIGLWVEGILHARDEYEAKIRDMARAGKLGLSSGAVSHKVRREKQANGSNQLKVWPIGEGSLTHTPADPHLARTVHAVKSLEEYAAEHEVEIKADLLGDDLEHSMACGVAGRLNDAMAMVLYTTIHDDTLDAAAKFARIGAAHDEYRAKLTAVLPAIFAAATEPEAKALAHAERAACLARLGSHLSMKAAAETIPAIVRAHTLRLESYAALKHADGHPVPADRLVEIGGLRDDLDALLAAAKAIGKPSPPAAIPHDDDALALAGLATLALLRR